MMVIVLRIPESISRPILTSWLHFKDVVRADEAFCNKVARSQFHFLLSSTHARFTVFEGTVEKRDCSVAFIRWVLNRRVFLDNLTPPPKLEAMPSLRKEFFEVIGPYLQRIHVQGALSNCLHAASQHCHRLAALRISECIYGDAEEVSTLGCLAIEQALLVVAQVNAHTLRNLVLSQCKAFGEDTFVTVAESCPNLRHLDLHGTVLTDTGLVRIVHAVPELAHMDIGCTEVTEAGLKILAVNCAHLQELYVPELGLTDRTITALAEHCPKLLHLTIGSNHDITDASLFVLAKHCPKLRVLSIPHCASITNTGIAALAKGCHHLRKLYMGGMLAVTDDAMLAVAEHCPELEELWVSCCAGITDTGVLAVGKGCRQLRDLTINGCWGVTSAALDGLRSDSLLVTWQRAYSVYGTEYDSEYSDGSLEWPGHHSTPLEDDLVPLQDLVDTLAL